VTITDIKQYLTIWQRQRNRWRHTRAL